MSKLNFRDIGDDWTPSAISIVDSPDHPLAVFEVYEDDEEFIKKSLQIEVEKMVEDNQIVSGPVSFFEKLFNRESVVVKSEETSTPEDKNNNDEVLEAISKLDAKLDKIDERVTKLENNNDTEPGDTEGSEEDNQGVVTKNDNGENPAADDVVIKSREVDPDEITVTKSEKSIYERIGRKSNGMTW